MAFKAGQIGRGLFAATLTDALPSLPVEEEGRLLDAGIRENFIERVFACARWQAFGAGRPRARDLVEFHAAHKFAILAHSPRAYSELGRLVAVAGPRLEASTLATYGARLMAALAVRATAFVRASAGAAGSFNRSRRSASTTAGGFALREKSASKNAQRITPPVSMM